MRSTAPSRVDLPISGMTCAACVGHVERALTATPGVVSAQVNLLANEARVTFRPAETNPEQLKAAIEVAGYHASEAATTPVEPPDEYPAVRRRALISLTLGAIAMAAMPFTGHGSTISNYAQLAAALFVMAGPGRAYYVRAAQGLTHRRYDMSTLIAVGTGSGDPSASTSAGVPKALLRSALMRAGISLGIFAGAMTPNQLITS